MGTINSILLVDDDNDDREIFQIVLSGVDKSIKLTTACDGVDALQKLSTATEGEVDLIFLDINMPRMDGIECLQQIKKNARLKNIPVIIYSTTSQENFVNKTLALGAISYLTKCNSFESLSESLKKILDMI
jgi:CheY-like chemotaxis protein